ncbi:MAG: hypothetical protein H7101_02465 [Deinococcales bacterium]|nr:hypothetical protein [Chitinophagaceae bacterium]
MKKLALLVILFFCAIAANAQDKITKHSGEIITCKIIEVGSSEIKFVPTDNPTGPMYTIEKDKVAKIEFGNGKKEKINNTSLDWRDPELYSQQLRKAIKINFFSPLYGYTEFTYEKSTSVGRSFEVSLGIIGAGKSPSLNFSSYNPTTNTYTYGNDKRGQFGLFGSYGYKFNKLPNFLFGKTKMSHIMQGSYVKPIVYAGNYSENVIEYKSGTNQNVIDRKNTTFAALQIEFGNQWVYGDKFLIDVYYGLGYGFDNKNNDYFDDSEAFNYANQRLGKSPGLSFTYGVRIGLLIK